MSNSGEKPKQKNTIEEWFGECLKLQREAKYLSRAELALKSTVAERTIRDIENNDQMRPSDRTLDKLAGALDCTVAELKRDCRRPTPNWLNRNKKWIMTGSAITAIILITVATIALTRTTWDHTNSTLTVRDGVFGITLWQYGPEPNVHRCIESPWDDNVLIIGLERNAPGDNRLLALDRLTGRELWRTHLDLDQMREVFGAEDVDYAKFTVNLLTSWLPSPNSEPELIVRYVHGKLYPAAVISVSSSGEVQNQYNFYGHITGLEVWDLDHDGSDEIILTSINNAKAYQGGMVTILDQDHFYGASIDSLAKPHPTIKDGSLNRVVFPAYPQPFLKYMTDFRSAAWEAEVVEHPNEETTINIMVGQNVNERIVVTMDSQLHPLHSEMTDTFRKTLESWPDSLTNGTGPGDDHWRAEWLATHHHFANGK